MNLLLRNIHLARSSSLDIPVSATPICNNASGGSEGGIGAILLVLSSLNYLKELQTYTSFPGTGGTVTFRARDGEAELTRMMGWTPLVKKASLAPY
jgi:hypothetical protein